MRAQATSLCHRLRSCVRSRTFSRITPHNLRRRHHPRLCPTSARARRQAASGSRRCRAQVRQSDRALPIPTAAAPSLCPWTRAPSPAPTFSRWAYSRLPSCKSRGATSRISSLLSRQARPTSAEATFSKFPKRLALGGCFPRLPKAQPGASAAHSSHRYVRLFRPLSC